MSGKKSVGTHDGIFHCDEVVAVMFLSLFNDITKIVRTRDAKILDGLDYVVDVGFKDDAAAGKFDHHQRGFDRKYPGSSATRMSSAGLVYSQFKNEIVGSLPFAKDFSAETKALFADMLYYAFVESIDAHDNGVSRFDGRTKYDDNTSLGARVSMMNRAVSDEEGQGKAFATAMSVAKADFFLVAEQQFNIFTKVYPEIDKAFANRKSFHSSGKALVIETPDVHWQSAFNTAARQIPGFADIEFIVMKKSDDWALDAVPVIGGAMFETRKKLPAAWASLSGDNLDKVLGTEAEPGAVFCHTGRFTCKHKTYTGIMHMLDVALTTVD